MHNHEHPELPVTRRAFLRRGVTMLGGAAIASSGIALAKECVLTPSDILGTDVQLWRTHVSEEASRR